MPKLWLSSPVGARFNDNEAQGAEQESAAGRCSPACGAPGDARG
jgi:hypothetical protein